MPGSEASANCTRKVRWMRCCRFPNCSRAALQTENCPTAVSCLAALSRPREVSARQAASNTNLKIPCSGAQFATPMTWSRCRFAGRFALVPLSERQDVFSEVGDLKPAQRQLGHVRMRCEQEKRQPVGTEIRSCRN